MRHTITVLTAVYTALGGIRAVIWTDVIQVVILFSALGFGLWFLLSATGGFATLPGLVLAHLTVTLPFVIRSSQPSSGAITRLTIQTPWGVAATLAITGVAWPKTLKNQDPGCHRLEGASSTASAVNSISRRADGVLNGR